MMDPDTVSKALIFAGSIFLAGCSGGNQSKEVVESTARPNIIFILADDLGYNELGSYGQKLIRTPNLDRLASEGMKFTQHYSGSTVCAPSRCVLLTGRHTGNSIVRDNYELGDFTDENEGGQLPLPLGTFTLATMLKDQGYKTAAIGKWGLGGPGSTGIPNNQGFDHFYGYLCQKQAHNYYPTHLWRNQEWDTLSNEYFNPHQELQGDIDDPKSYEPFKAQDYTMDLMAEEALNFLQENHQDPFFLYLPFPVPHLALQIPDQTLNDLGYSFPETPYTGDKGYSPHQTPRAAYAAMITNMDRQIGRILSLLKELGVEENTLVFFSSDNGTTFDVGGVDREFFSSLGPLKGYKTTLYEGGIRVPMIAKWPGKIKPGSTSDHVSAFWDVVPTIADITGGKHPEDVDGISFLPTLIGEPDQQDHDYLYWEFHGRWDGAQAARMGDWKAVRLGGHLDPAAPIELYDLATDIGEEEDVAESNPEVVKKVKEFMDRRTRSDIEEWNFAQESN